MNNNFLKEIEKYDYAELKLIYETQKDMYSKEEMKIIKERLEELKPSGEQSADNNIYNSDLYNYNDSSEQFTSSMEILPNNNLKVRVGRSEFENSKHKEQFIVETYKDNIKDYYKIISDNEERNTILNIWIYKKLTTITRIAKFFFIFFIVNIVVSIILALK